MSHGFSKSRYVLFCQCPKILWLSAYKPEEKVIDAATQAAFTAGNAVGDLAMGYLGPYVEVHAEKPDGKLDLGRMIELTHEYIQRGEENIAEASFSYKGNYCAVDILHRQGDGYAIYEVKSSSGNPATPMKREDALVYVRDIAYQKYVLTKCGVKVTGTYLIRINNQYVLDGELDIHGLFYHEDLSKLVNEEYSVVEANIADAMKLLDNVDEPVRSLGMHCFKPYECSFWNYCSRRLPSPSVFDLNKIHKKDAFELYNDGKASFTDLQSNPRLTTGQCTQIESTLSNEPHINPTGIRQWLDKLSCPLYFLDFETIQQAVPVYQKTKPFQQIPFQYSLHIQDRPGSIPAHKEFLAKTGVDPRRELAERLCADIPRDVCTLAYNKSFECGRIAELAAAYPDLADHLLNIRDHIIDLIEPFRAWDCYLPAMNGSFSIKSVLPALFPNDHELDYHSLNGIHNGSEAMNAFPMLASLPVEKQAELRQSLLAYCRLDTLAMVKVLQRLIELSRQE